MCEWLKQAVLKTAVPERVPGVRIPLPPPSLPFSGSLAQVRSLHSVRAVDLLGERVRGQGRRGSRQRVGTSATPSPSLMWSKCAPTTIWSSVLPGMTQTTFGRFWCGTRCKVTFSRTHPTSRNNFSMATCRSGSLGGKLRSRSPIVSGFTGVKRICWARSGKTDANSTEARSKPRSRTRQRFSTTKDSMAECEELQTGGRALKQRSVAALNVANTTAEPKVPTV